MINKKALICGLLISVTGLTCISAADGIRYVIFNGTKVIYNGRTLDLNGQRLISLAKDGEQYSSNYMPVRAVLEAMGHRVSWDGQTSTVEVSSGTENPGGGSNSYIYSGVPDGGSNTNDYSGEPGDGSNTNGYSGAAVQSELPPTVAVESVKQYVPEMPKRITIPERLNDYEHQSYKLIAEIMQAEMGEGGGIVSIMSSAEGMRLDSQADRKKLAEALYKAVNDITSKGSKKALSSVYRPEAYDSAEYKTIYDDFKCYVDAQENVLSSLRDINMEAAFEYYRKAEDIYRLMLTRGGK